jgi:hypothetical protein
MELAIAIMINLFHTEILEVGLVYSLVISLPDLHI